MRKICLAIAFLMLAGGSGFAQSRPAPEKPIDKGPFTPEASRAYQGGGVVLEGAPGAPAPKPEATPPGQVPAHMVPPK